MVTGQLTVLAIRLLSATVLQAAAISLPTVACQPSENRKQEGKVIKVQIDVDGARVIGELDDGLAARDFASLLPLTVTLEDYGTIEKIADLPRRLDIRGMPAGTAAAQGDITYYAPWGNLAIFQKEFRYSEGLVKIGRIDVGLSALRRKGSIKATIRLADD